MMTYNDACNYAADRARTVKRAMAVLAPEADNDGFDVIGHAIALRWPETAETIVAVFGTDGERTLA